jgi:hypothetical protein
MALTDIQATNGKRVMEIPLGVAPGVLVDGLSLAQSLTAIKAKTDGLTFTVPGEVDSNILSVIGDPVKTNSSKTTNWGGT